MRPCRAIILVVSIVTAVLFTSSCSKHEKAHLHSQEETSEGASLSGSIKEGVRVIPIQARKFSFEPDTIVVKAGERVRIEATSVDVTHGITIEGLNINRALPPNRTQVIEFVPDKPGNYHFHCSVYCGTGHSGMHGTLIVKGEGGEVKEEVSHRESGHTH